MRNTMNRGRSISRSMSVRPMRRRRFVSRSRTPRSSIPTQVAADFSRALTVRRRSMTHPTSVSLDATGNRGLAFKFRLSDIPGYTSIQQVYDEYRIDFVKLIIHMGGVSNSVVAAAIDQNDNTTPTTQSEVLKMETCRTVGKDGNLTLYIRPKQQGIDLPPNGRNPFCPTATPDLDHFGAKLWGYIPGGGASVIADVYAEYWISYRKAK